MVWMKLTSIYGQLFVTKNGVSDSGVWFMALKDLTPKALESGIERLMNLSHGKQFCDFPPNPLQFRALCLGFYEQLRLPSASDAYREIKSRSYITSENWSHSVVKYTAKRLGIQFLETDDDAKTYAQFKRVYEQVCHLVKQGHEVPEIKDPIMRVEKNPVNNAKTHLNQMRQLLGVMK